MAPLPRPFSRSASLIESAISEGRAEEAMHKLVHALRGDGDSKAIRFLAADWIERIGLPGGAAKTLRKGNKALLEDWLDISEMVGKIQAEGKTRDQAIQDTAGYFGCSDRHVEKCVAEWNKVAQAHREEG
ncbi:MULTISPECIES: hypothetical protein [unclassified Mesorhizobium]|uniref:hypothetical protein n=1 Tax=unclassified Mesorhizobium TaxID=325217 RepID=UPI000FCB0C89|nr:MULTISPECIES: hypothetical protein [unclassified Mesorhizobium]RUW69279.1 hypothetical protein EOA31_23500 [Mesorhizobium sp. M4B.F.Ca.ET.049.02.1.2]RVD70776.1 hypothetical protein EN751_18895 [Mesorhizobium sp. M4A.F.Ca.ET.029.04.2.1]TGV26447.1 hypothetical protein EN786_13110 [Mesorhizobium sp. M4B.F.Ca.ET.143.01.1.1]TIW36537.1 MAG: hypothetical protein E5V62_06155 [Mesorhizobium sp.]